MPTSDPAVVDANVLIYAVYDEMEHHAAANSLLEQAQDGELSLCIVPQVLAEFYAVVTDARRVTEPFQPNEALDLIDQLVTSSGLTLLPVPVDLVTRWIQLARRRTPCR